MSKIFRQAFLDVCNGYSVSKFEGKPLYIKHLSHRDHLSFDDAYDSAFKEAVDGGILEEKKQLDYLREEGLWTEDGDVKIDQKRHYISQLEANKKNFHYPSQLESHIKAIQKEQEELKKLESKRFDLMGMTAESYATKIVNDYYMLKSFFSDRDLSVPLFTEEEFDSVDDKQLEELMKLHKEESDVCSEFNLKKLSFQEFFISYYYLCEDNVYYFFGKPVSQLTFNQLKLVSFAKYFKSLLEGVNLNNLPKHIVDNPDELINYLTATENGKKLMDKNNHANVSLVGSTREDIKALAGEQNQSLPNQNMSMKDLIEQRRKQLR